MIYIEPDRDDFLDAAERGRRAARDAAARASAGRDRRRSRRSWKGSGRLARIGELVSWRIGEFVGDFAAFAGGSLGGLVRLRENRPYLAPFRQQSLRSASSRMPLRTIDCQPEHAFVGFVDSDSEFRDELAVGSSAACRPVVSQRHPSRRGAVAGRFRAPPSVSGSRSTECDDAKGVAERAFAQFVGDVAHAATDADAVPRPSCR